MLWVPLMLHGTSPADRSDIPGRGGMGKRSYFCPTGGRDTRQYWPVIPTGPFQLGRRRAWKGRNLWNRHLLGMKEPGS